MRSRPGFTQFVVEQVDVVTDAILVQQLVELLVIDAVRPLHFAVQAGCAGPNVAMPDVSALQVPMELRLEFCRCRSARYARGMAKAAAPRR